MTDNRALAHQIIDRTYDFIAEISRIADVHATVSDIDIQITIGEPVVQAQTEAPDNLDSWIREHLGLNVGHRVIAEDEIGDGPDVEVGAKGTLVEIKRGMVTVDFDGIGRIADIDPNSLAPDYGLFDDAAPASQVLK